MKRSLLIMVQVPPWPVWRAPVPSKRNQSERTMPALGTSRTSASISSVSGTVVVTLSGYRLVDDRKKRHCEIPELDVADAVDFRKFLLGARTAARHVHKCSVAKDHIGRYLAFPGELEAQRLQLIEQNRLLRIEGMAVGCRTGCSGRTGVLARGFVPVERTRHRPATGLGRLSRVRAPP